jgi:hypothetical protein
MRGDASAPEILVPSGGNITFDELSDSNSYNNDGEGNTSFIACPQGHVFPPQETQPVLLPSHSSVFNEWKIQCNMTQVCIDPCKNTLKNQVTSNNHAIQRISPLAVRLTKPPTIKPTNQHTN